jgi:hypothetical protein
LDVKASRNGKKKPKRIDTLKVLKFSKRNIVENRLRWSVDVCLYQVDYCRLDDVLWRELLHTLDPNASTDILLLRLIETRDAQKES